MSPVGVTKIASGGLAVSQAPAGYGLPCLLAAGQAITVVPSGGLPIADVGGGIFTALVVSATWDPATVTAVTLSGGNLVATNTGTTSTDQGARVAAASGKTAGKYYFEVTWTTITNPTSSNLGVGIGTTASTYTGMGNSAATGDITFSSSSVWANGSSALATLGGAWLAGNIVGMAVDLDNRRIWFRGSPSGNWNNNATYNPVTNVGGVTIPAGTMVPFAVFGGASGVASNVLTANFGASAFTGAVPAGFTSGWPA